MTSKKSAAKIFRLIGELVAVMDEGSVSVDLLHAKKAVKSEAMFAILEIEIGKHRLPSLLEIHNQDRFDVNKGTSGWHAEFADTKTGLALLIRHLVNYLEKSITY